MDDTYVRKILTTVILSVLLVLSFFLLKPILLSIITALILAFIFNPIYNWVYKLTKLENFSALIICVFLMLLIIIPLWFLTPIFIDQSLKIYMSSQQMDFVTPLKTIFPSFFASDEFSAEVGSILYSFTTKMTNSATNSLSNIILNFPILSMYFLVVFFTFFFFLRDQKKLVAYIQSLLPFSKNVEKKLFDSSRLITSAVIYGQIIVGIIQGLIVGLGFFIFGVPNALFLTLIATLAGIFPIIGTVIVWLPVVIYLFIAGNSYAAIGVVIFGLISSIIDNFLRTIIISKRTRMHSALILVGMIGGLFLFGILGLILGPLILAYLIIILEIYRIRPAPGIFIQQSNKSLKSK